MHLTIVGGTDKGRVREHNEDALLFVDLDEDGGKVPAERTPAARMSTEVGEGGVLLAVSDGLGGAAAGEVASAATVHALHDELRSIDLRGDEKKSLAHVVARANRDVLHAAERPSRAGMGATLTAALIRSDSAFLAQVGDSRAYLLRDGELRQVTKDQSFVQMLVDQGEITPEEAEHHPQKNIVSQVMGQKKPVRADVGRLPLKKNDRLLLCSDGLFNALSEDEIARVLSTSSDPVNDLITAANAAGGPDNITVVIAAVA